MSTPWRPIRYRDFHDVPRLFVVADGEAVFVFDCPFDAALDEYPADYHVYRLPPGAVIPESGSWEQLPGLGTLLGRVPVDRVRFDPTLRAAIDSSILDSFGG